ncbi:MAG: c-type cytochrome [Nitrospirota bacterium]
MQKSKVWSRFGTMIAVVMLLSVFVAFPIAVRAGDAKNGKKLFHGRPVANCVACHYFKGIEFPSDISPDFAEIMEDYADTPKDREKLRQWIYDAKKTKADPFMPSYGASKLLIFKGEENLPEDQKKKLIEQRIDDIVEYLYTLKEK